MGETEMKKLSLVIPAYNESKIILDTLAAVTAELSRLTEDYEVLIVDDGSTDDMAALVKGCGDPHVRLTGYQPNHGKGRAVRTGMLEAEGEIILCTDADLAYGTAVFADLLERLENTGADLAIGSRRLSKDGYRDYPPLRLLASKCFKGYRREAAKRIFSQCTNDGFAFDFEVLMTADAMKMKVEQIPVSIVNHRESKVNVLRDSARMFRDIFHIRRAVRRRMEGK